VTGLRPAQVAKAIRASLDRLGTDHVDLYQVHFPDQRVPLEDTWGGMAEAQDQGLALHLGLSNVGRSQVERCEDIRHVDSVQNSFSLLHQEDRDDLLVSLVEMGVGYLAYSPLAMGMLTGAIGRGHRFDEGDFRSGSRGEQPEFFRPHNLDGNVERVERLREVAKRLATTAAPLALRWVLSQTGVTAAVAGSRSADHVRNNATAGDLQIDHQTLEEIDALFA
jgi:aryl-alcohol dehydrogenase-like predicted oxidoreductase